MPRINTTKTAVPKVHCAVTNEIGINATDLLKQVLSLSQNYFTLLPYDLTYKLIFKNCAIRIGAGLSVLLHRNLPLPLLLDNPRPFKYLMIIPTINNSTTIYYRGRSEYRFHLSERFVAYAGVDFIGQYGKILSQYCNLEQDDLPYEYYYNSNKSNTTVTAYGGVTGGGNTVLLHKEAEHIHRSSALFSIYSPKVKH